MPLPAFMSPSWIENEMSELFMSAIRLGTPVRAWTSLYGRSPHRPTAYSNVLLLPFPLPATAIPAVAAAARATSRTRTSLRRDTASSPVDELCEPVAARPAGGFRPGDD